MENLFEPFLAIIFGAIFGSYATLFAYRLPRNESCFGRYFGPKSRCPNCNNIIPTSSLIPLINWLITLGKCQKCKTKIPRTHLFVELATTILFLFCYLNFGFSERFILSSLISVTLLILLVCDYTHKSLPFQALIFLTIIVVANRVLTDNSILPLVATLSFGVIFSAIFYKLIYKNFPNFFIDQNHFFSYLSLIIIASLAMNPSMFLFYLSIISISLLMLFIFKVLHNRNSLSLGYIFILPFIWNFCIATHSFG